MIEEAYTTEVCTKEVVDVDNSHVYCDYCDVEIPIDSKFYHITTGHYDWGHDSCESVEYKQICSSDCLVKYITYNYTENHGLHRSDSQFCEIEKKTFNKSYIENYGEDI